MRFLFKTMTNNCRTRTSFRRTTCSCWRHWTSSSPDLSVNFIPTELSVQRKVTTSSQRRRRSERTRSCCQCSVASLRNSFNCFSMRSTNADSSTFASSSLDHEVCRYI